MAGIVYLGLGTNIGNKRKNLITAASLLAERAGDVLIISRFYESEPCLIRLNNSSKYIGKQKTNLPEKYCTIKLTAFHMKRQKSLSRTNMIN